MAWWKFWQGGSRSRQSPDYYAEGVHLAGEERYHEALTSFRLALRERPADVACMEQMATVYTRMGMTDEAIRMYRRALAARPESAPSHYGLAFLLLRRGAQAEAADHLRHFLREGPRAGGSAEHLRHARETLRQIAETTGTGESALDE